MIYDFLKQNLRPDSIIVEVGMHHGEDTERFLKYFPECTVWGFEPDPRCISKIKLKNLPKSVQLIEAAASNFNGRSVFYQSDSKDGWDHSGSLHEPKEHLHVFPHITFDKKIEVTTVRLDDMLLDEIKGGIDLIWIDAQGHEYGVLQGSLQLLKRTKYLYFEVSDIEYYKGQKKLDDIHHLIGGDWRLINGQMDGNALMENTVWKT